MSSKQSALLLSHILSEHEQVESSDQLGLGRAPNKLPPNKKAQWPRTNTDNFRTRIFGAFFQTFVLFLISKIPIVYLTLEQGPDYF